MEHQDHLSRRARWAGDEPLVAALMARALRQPDLISLAAGFVDQFTLPIEPTRQAMEFIWSDADLARKALQYGTTAGYPPLREALVAGLLQADGRTAAELNVDLASVVVTAGSNQLLFLVGDVLLDPGDIVICAAPSYYVFLGTLANLGAAGRGSRGGRGGPGSRGPPARVSSGVNVPASWSASKPFMSPRITTIPAAQRSPCGGAELVEIAKRWSRRQRIYLIEDAAYRELRYRGDDTPSLRAFDAEGDTVVHAGTFSKSFSPGIRVGWGVLPPALAGPVVAEKGNADFGSPNFNQVLMAKVLEEGLFDAQVERLRTAYREKLVRCWLRPTSFWARSAAFDGFRPPAGCTCGCACPRASIQVWKARCSRRRDRRRALCARPVLLSGRRAAASEEHAAAELWSSSGAAASAGSGSPGAGHSTGALKMHIIDRYLLRQFLQTFAICFCSLWGLVIVIDVSTNLQEFLHAGEKAGGVFRVVAQHYGINSILFFRETSHFLALVSAMFTTTWIQRHNEMTALMSAGIARIRVMLPIIVAVSIVSVLSAVDQELLIPRHAAELSRDSKNLLGDHPQGFTPHHDDKIDVEFSGQNTYADEKKIEEPNFLLRAADLRDYGWRLKAESAYYVPPSGGRPGGYLFKGVYEPKNLDTRPSLPRTGDPVLITPRDAPDWLEPDQCFLKSDVDFDQLTLGATFKDLSSTAQLISAVRNPGSGYGADTCVAIHARIVRPLLDITLLFLGLPLVVTRESRNVFLAIGACVALSAVFMLVVFMCQWLGGNACLIPAALAAWLPLMIFAPAAVGMADSMWR